jgi:hypothetical protein
MLHSQSQPQNYSRQQFQRWNKRRATRNKSQFCIIWFFTICGNRITNQVLSESRKRFVISHRRCV